MSKLENKILKATDKLLSFGPPVEYWHNADLCNEIEISINRIRNFLSTLIQGENADSLANLTGVPLSLCQELLVAVETIGLDPKTAQLSIDREIEGSSTSAHTS